MINFFFNRNLVKLTLFCFFSWIIIAVNAQTPADSKAKQKPVSALAEGLKKLEKEASSGKVNQKKRGETAQVGKAENAATDGANKLEAPSGLADGLKKLAKEIENVDKHKTNSDTEAATRSARIAETLATISLIKNEQAGKKEAPAATGTVTAAAPKIDAAPVNSAPTNTLAENPNANVSSNVPSTPLVPAGEQRLALVIGNSTYKTSPLMNPANDARAREAAPDP